jgi:hypothetical protein
MLKWTFALLLLVNMLVFAVLRWSGESVDEANPLPQAPLNAQKIILLKPEVMTASSVASSAVTATSAPVAVAANSPIVPVSATVIASAPSSPLPATQLSCLEWGELSGVNVQRAEKMLASWSLGNKVQQRAVDVVTGYWVFIGPLRSRLEVEQKVMQLKARQVLDHFVVTEAGAWQNAISLGVFKTEEAAKKHLVKLQAQGVRTAVVGAHGNKMKAAVFLFKGLSNDEVIRVNGLRKVFPESEIKNLSCS